MIPFRRGTHFWNRFGITRPMPYHPKSVYNNNSDNVLGFGGQASDEVVSIMCNGINTVVWQINEGKVSIVRGTTSDKRETHDDTRDFDDDAGRIEVGADII